MCVHPDSDIIIIVWNFSPMLGYPQDQPGGIDPAIMRLMAEKFHFQPSFQLNDWDVFDFESGQFSEEHDVFKVFVYIKMLLWHKQSAVAGQQ